MDVLCPLTSCSSSLTFSPLSRNYEFQSYDLNITNTFVRDGIFYIRPTLTENRIGAKALRETGVLDIWGMDPGSQCTGNYDYGCFRVAGAGGNILNPIQSGLVRTVNSFKFRYGKVVVRAKMPKGKWIWPVTSFVLFLLYLVLFFFLFNCCLVPELM